MSTVTFIALTFITLTFITLTFIILTFITEPFSKKNPQAVNDNCSSRLHQDTRRTDLSFIALLQQQNAARWNVMYTK